MADISLAQGRNPEPAAVVRKCAIEMRELNIIVDIMLVYGHLISQFVVSAVAIGGYAPAPIDA